MIIIPLDVEVTWKDLDEGIRNNSSCCALALALRRAINYTELYPDEVEVEGDIIGLVLEGPVGTIYEGLRNYEISGKQIGNFVESFDKEEGLPTKFHLVAVEIIQDDY